MKKICTKDDIIKNMKTLDKYLTKQIDPEYTYAIEKIKNGICFISVKQFDGSYRFYPSRFMGYQNNTMNKHEDNETRNGGTTNIYISSILKCKPEYNSSLEHKYLEYCITLGFDASKRKRKYWMLDV